MDDGPERLVTGWWDLAICKDQTDLFYPSKNDSVGAALAKAVCCECPVRVPCLDAAIEGGEKYGIWGGTSERERRAIRAKLRVDQRAAAV